MPLIQVRPMLRAWLAGFVLLGMAACQQPASDAGAAAKPTVAPELDSGGFQAKQSGKHYFTAEENTLRHELMKRMVDACFHSMTDPAKMDSCFRDRFADAFDDSGKGRSGCAGHTNIDDYTNCLATGNTILDIRRRLNDQTPVSAGFWSSPEEMVKAFAVSVLVQGSESCGQNKSDAAAMDCLDGWLTDKLDMPSDLLDRCPHGLVNSDRQECFGQAIALRYIRDHVPRVSGLGT